MRQVAGFIPGIVKDNNDPLGGGRVRAFIPGIAEPMTAYWIMPAGWPGAGGIGQGSKYPPPPIDAQIYIMFEQGIVDDPEPAAIYLTGYYGQTDTGADAGPTCIANAPTADQNQQRTCIWEDDKFRIYERNEPTATPDPVHKLFIESVSGGMRIILDAYAGEAGGSEILSIESRSGMSLYSEGLIDIDARVVQIKGRRVLEGAGTI